MGHLLKIRLLFLTTFFTALVALAEEEPQLIEARNLQVLPIAPQDKDGFGGQPQTAFSPPPIKNFSAEMLRKATRPKKKSKTKGTKKKATKK